MDAETERGVTVLGPIEHDLVGLLEQLGIAVGCRERQQHPLVLLHRAAVEVTVLGDHAGHGDGRVRPQELLDGGRHELGLTGQAAPVVGVRGEVPDAGSDGAPRRVDAGDQQQHDRSAHVLVRQLVAVELDVEEVGDEVVARFDTVALDVLVEVLLGALEAQSTLLRGPVDALERVVHEPAELLVVLDRQPEHARDHVDRDVLGVLLGGVDDGLARRDLAHVVEALPAQFANLRLPRLDLLGRERRQQQPAGQTVERRIAGDRRRAADAGWCFDRRRADDD